MKRTDELKLQARKVKTRRVISPSLKRDLLEFYGFDVIGSKSRKYKEN